MRTRICMAVAILVLTAIGASAQRSFSNDEFRFGFTYPSNFKVQTRDLGIAETTKFRNLIWLEAPGARNVYASALVAAGAMSRADCRTFDRAYDDNRPVQTQLGRNTFDKLTDVDGGMESETLLEIYHAFRNGICYGIELKVGGNRHVPWGKNSDELFADLQVILRTMHFDLGESTSSVAPPCAEDQLSLSAETSGMTYPESGPRTAGLFLTNGSRSRCSISGTPGFVFVDKNGRIVDRRYYPKPGTVIALEPGDEAMFNVKYTACDPARDRLCTESRAEFELFGVPQVFPSRLGGAVRNIVGVSELRLSGSKGQIGSDTEIGRSEIPQCAGEQLLRTPGTSAASFTGGEQSRPWASTWFLRNISRTECSVSGTPGFVQFDRWGRVIGQRYSPRPGPAVVLEPGEEASFEVKYVPCSLARDYDCTQAADGEFQIQAVPRVFEGRINDPLRSIISISELKPAKWDDSIGSSAVQPCSGDQLGRTTPMTRVSFTEGDERPPTAWLIRNTSQTECSVSGTPGLTLVDDRGQVVDRRYTPRSGSAIVLKPGDEAAFDVQYYDCSWREEGCGRSTAEFQLFGVSRVFTGGMAGFVRNVAGVSELRLARPNRETLASSAAPCSGDQLSILPSISSASLWSSGEPDRPWSVGYRLRNNSRTECSTSGTPGFVLLDRSDRALGPRHLPRSGTPLTLRPGEEATFYITYNPCLSSTERDCRRSAKAEVQLPGVSSRLVAADHSISLRGDIVSISQLRLQR